MRQNRRTGDLLADRERVATYAGKRAAPRSARTLALLLIGALVSVAAAAPARAQAPPPNVAVTPAAGSLAFQDPTVAVDPTNQARLAISYYDYSTPRQCSLALSSDGGTSWSTKVVVGDGGQIPLTGEQATCWSPRIAYGPSGTLYYIYQTGRAVRSDPRQVLIATSHDGGATFDAPVLLDPSTNRIVFAQVAVTVDQASGRVYAAWANQAGPDAPTFANRRVFVASSGDEGRTFSTPVPVSPLEQSLADEPSLVVNPDHTLHVTWRVFGETATTIFAATSRSQGQTFSAPSEVFDVDPGCLGGTPQCTRPVEYAADNVSHWLAGGTSPGQLFAVGWVPVVPVAGGFSTSNRRLIFSASADGGATWTPSRVVGVPAGHESDDQARPSLTVTPTGRIVIIYQNMPTTEGGVQGIFEIHSDDGGNSFSAPQQLNSAPSDIRVGPASFSTFNGGSTASLGAHSGIASSASAVFFAWTDTRRGNLDTRKQDIFFAALPLPRTPAPTPVNPPPANPPAANPPAASPPAADASGCGKFTSKLSLVRATFNERERTISILAPITRRASGSVRITLFAAGRTVTFTAPIDSKKGRIRITRKIPAAQARLGTGILTIRYSGDADTRPQTLRVRAASNLARLQVEKRPTFTSTGFVRASGTVSRRARGVVRIKLQYVNRSDGQTVTLERAALINKGRWSLNRKLSPSLITQISRRCGSLHSYTVFTGYLPRRMNGEQQSLQVLPAL